MNTLNGLIVVPVYNEEKGLPRVIDHLRSVFSDDSLLFVNDGSNDHSLRVLQSFGVRHLSHPINLGYREAILSGVVAAHRDGREFVAFFDADGQHRLDDLLELIKEFEKRDADLLIGSRFATGRGIPWRPRNLGNLIFSLIAAWSIGSRITDSTCGLKILSRDYFGPMLALQSEDLHAEMLLGLARAGARIREVPIRVEPREEGTSMYHFSKALAYPARTLLCLLAGVLTPPAGRSEPFESDPVRHSIQDMPHRIRSKTERIYS